MFSALSTNILTKDELLAKNIMVPRYAEQQQIGAFFKQLDNLITLHQRECISFTARAGRLILTANKKRNTSSWEQRKLGDIASDSRITVAEHPHIELHVTVKDVLNPSILYIELQADVGNLVILR